MLRKFYKHKLLLDEGFHLRSRLPITNSRFNIKHVSADFGKSSLPDPEVYLLAHKQGRILITYNVKDFKKLVDKKMAGIIGISPNLPLSQIDKKLTALLMKNTKKKHWGKLMMINEG